jgi:hypothetical protein
MGISILRFLMDRDSRATPAVRKTTLAKGGLGSAALLVRAVHGLVHGVSALDPFSYATAGLLMLAGSAAAAAMAAARLGRASPTEALRAE